MDLTQILLEGIKYMMILSVYVLFAGTFYALYLAFKDKNERHF